jgi:hypothetical protein
MLWEPIRKHEPNLNVGREGAVRRVEYRLAIISGQGIPRRGVPFGGTPSLLDSLAASHLFQVFRIAIALHGNLRNRLFDLS